MRALLAAALLLLLPGAAVAQGTGKRTLTLAVLVGR